MKLQMFASMVPARRTTATRPAPTNGSIDTETEMAEAAPALEFDWLDRSTGSKPRVDTLSIRVTRFGVIISKPLATALANGADEVRLRIGVSKDRTAVGLMHTNEGMYTFKLDSKVIRVGATSLAKKLIEVGLPEGKWLEVTEVAGVYVAHVPVTEAA